MSPTSPATFSALVPTVGSALVHFLWQGLALAALAAVGMALARTPRARYAIGVLALAVMITAPLFTVALLGAAARAHGTTAADRTAAEAPLFASEASRSEPRASAGSETGSSTAERHRLVPLTLRMSPARLQQLVALWLIGVALLGLRTAGGVWMLHGLRRRSAGKITAPILRICTELERELGLRLPIRYRSTTQLAVPAVVGWLRPVVLLPVQALTGLSECQLRLVIAHELAHIRRLDPFVNVVQVATETLLFYHPAVWWLNRRIRAEREHCCDDIAVAVCDDRLEYAKTLAELGRHCGAPTLAAAYTHGSVADRVARLLGARSAHDRDRGSRLAASVVCLTIAASVGVLVPEIVAPEAADAAVGLDASSLEALYSETEVEDPTALPDHPRRPTPLAPAERRSPLDTPAHAGLEASPKISEIETAPPEVRRAPARGATEPRRDSTEDRNSEASTPARRADRATEAASEPAAYAVHQVTREFREQIRAVGLDPTPGGFVALRVHGITADYVRRMRSSGLEIDTVDDIVELRVHRTTPEYVAELRASGIEPIDSDEVVAYRVHGITADFVRGLREAGLDFTARQVVQLRVHGATPSFVRALRAAGLEVDVSRVVAARVHGITPEFIRQADRYGFSDLDLPRLVRLRELGILEAPGPGTQ